MINKILQRDSALFFTRLFLCIIFLFSAVFTYEESYPELEKEIKALQKKISTTKDNIKNVKKKIKADKQAFSAYQKQYKRYFNQQNAELDSLKNDYSRLQYKADSLSQSIQEVKSKQHELDLLQERFFQLSLNACKELKATLLRLPPGNTQNQINALDFLHSELSVKAVDNVEALARLWQILLALTEGSQSIDIFPAQSPVPFISGQVDFIRLGYAYLAIVNEKGTAGALWIPSADSSGGTWIENKNPQHLLALKKCVKIRQGNAVPEIIGIPFKHPIHADTLYQKGGNQ